jgi:hypothetical protein
MNFFSMLDSIPKEGNAKMSHDCAITQRLLSNQRTMFRLAEAGFGFSQKAIHLLTGMSLSVIGQYARGETAMGGAAILKLSGIRDFPAELLTLLYSGTGRIVVDTPELSGSTAEYDDLARGALALALEIQQARSQNSPGGPEIVAVEEPGIQAKHLRLVTKNGSKAA